MPGLYAPVVIRDPQGRQRMVPRQWGVPPPPRGDHVVPHIRNLASPFWIGTLRHTQFRCLVPATSFASGRQAGKAQRWLSVPSLPIFAFAGIWRDSEVPSFALVTTEANPLVASGGAAAMPVILHPEDHDRWLAADWKDAQILADSFPAQLMRMQAG